MLRQPTKEESRIRYVIQLTDRHIKVYSAIKKYVKAHGVSPSLRELAWTTEISLSQIHKYLKDLESLGYIKRMSNRSRSIRIL